MTHHEPEQPATPQQPSPPTQGENRPSLFGDEGLAERFFAVVFVVCGLGLLYVLKAFLTDLVVSFILVGLFSPVYRRVREGLGDHKWLASAVVTWLILAIILLPMAGLVYTIVQEARAYESVVGGTASASALEVYGQHVASMLQRLHIHLSSEDVKGFVLEAAQDIRSTVIAWGSAVLSNTLAAVVHFAIVLVLVFYLLVDGERLKQFAFHLSPLPDDEDALIVQTFRRVALGVVVGNGAGSALQGILGGIAMAVVGLASPVLWGSVMAILAFLPLVGISAVVLPATAYLALVGRPWAALGFLGFCTMQSLIVENVIKTKLIGSHMRMHDLLVFLSLLGGIAAFGIVGLVYGPLIAMLFMTLTDLYWQSYHARIAARFSPARRTRG
jgi:predicted PurR-regulated permease PerM